MRGIVVREEFLDGLDLLRTAGDPGAGLGHEPNDPGRPRETRRRRRDGSPKATRGRYGRGVRRVRGGVPGGGGCLFALRVGIGGVGIGGVGIGGAARPGAARLGARPRGISSPAPARRGGLRGEDGDVEHRTATFQRVRRRVRPTTREVQTRGVFRPNGREDALFRHRLCRRRGGQRTRGGGGGGSSERGRGVDKRTDDRGAKTPSRRRLG